MARIMDRPADKTAPASTSQRLQAALAPVVRLLDLMNAGLRILLALTLATMVIIVTLQIVVRFILPKLGIIASVPWSEELVRYLLIWSVFIGGGVAARRGGMIAVEALPNALPPGPARAVRVAGLAVMLTFLVLAFGSGLDWVAFGAHERSTAMGLPMAWIYAAMPAGMALMGINLIAAQIAPIPQTGVAEDSIE